MRASWDSYFMGITKAVALRSTCDRASVGAVITKNRRILTTGYNGALPQMPHCDDVGHWMVNDHCIRIIHAEMNAIIQAAIYGIPITSATCYVTHYPCFTCAKSLIAVKIDRIVYAELYRVDENTNELFTAANIEIEKYAI